MLDVVNPQTFSLIIILIVVVAFKTFRDKVGFRQIIFRRYLCLLICAKIRSYKAALTPISSKTVNPLSSVIVDSKMADEAMVFRHCDGVFVNK